jgi:choline dehydrogenase
MPGSAEDALPDLVDFVVVGAGSAGCVLAARLADAGQTVCVLEAGGADRHPLIRIPAGYIRNVFNPKLTWGFISAPVAGADGRELPLPQGRVVGGSSAINGMIYNRGQPSDYDGWAQRGARGWSYEEVLPYFRRSERRLGEADQRYRGTNGPLVVSDLDFNDPLCALFIQAAEGLGAPLVADYNAAAQDGVGPFQFTIDPTGGRALRASAAHAFLHPALKQGRIELVHGAWAERIIVEDGQAVGVRYRRGGPRGPVAEVRARGEVILSCGALNTPRLLQLSGIGDGGLVQRLGVPLVSHVPGVGENLSDHFQVRVSARLAGIATLNERARMPRLVVEVLRWLTGRPSLLALGPVPMRLFHRSDPALEVPDIQMSFTPASFRAGTTGLLDVYPGMTIGGYRQRPDSRGYVRAASPDIAVPPTIQPNYLDARADRSAIVEVVRMARRLMAAPAFAPHFVQETFPGAAVGDDDEAILAFCRAAGGTAFHPTGTARMGRDDDRLAVVDPALRVRGVGRLRVADASVMPTPVSGNTNAPTMMIGEKAADLVLSAMGPDR